MSGRAPQVWVGDLARALDRLAPRDDATAAAIASTLGLAQSAVAAEPPPEVVAGVDAAPDEPTPYVGGGPGAEPDPDTGARPAELAFVRTERPDTTWMPSAPPIDRGGGSEIADASPLLDPLVTRGVVGAALSTHDEHGPVDVAAAIERIARGRPLEGLPRRRWPTLRHGAQVLLDGGEGMTPFAGDVVGLVDEMRRHLGTDRLTVLRFTGCPTRGAGVGARRTWGEWRPPRPGVPIAVVSDLGIARPPLSLDAAPVGEWLAFADMAHRAGCPLVVFLPYRAGRVAPALRHAMSIVPWSERTSATRVRASIGGVLRRPA